MRSLIGCSYSANRFAAFADGARGAVTAITVFCASDKSQAMTYFCDSLVAGCGTQAEIFVVQCIDTLPRVFLITIILHDIICNTEALFPAGLRSDHATRLLLVFGIPGQESVPERIAPAPGSQLVLHRDQGEQE